MTILSISWLKGGHGNQFLTSMGLGDEEQRLNWCSNRVASMTLSQKGSSIVEKSGKWLWLGTHEVELNYLDIEKWFAKYCQLNIKKVQFSDFNSPLNPILKVEFIDGEAATFYDLGEKRIQVQDQIFKSATFDKAIKELLDFAP